MPKHRQSILPDAECYDVDLVAGARNYLNLLYYSKHYPLLSQMAIASHSGLFRGAA